MSEFSDDMLEFMSKCTSQYDSVCRELAAEVLQLRRKVKELEKNDE